MPIITPEEETLIQRALQGVREGRFPYYAAASRHYDYNYDVLRARARGIQGNWSRGGRNKRLNNEEEATLVRYCERRILCNDPLEHAYIIAAANIILWATGKKHVLKQWVTRWIKVHPDLLYKRKTKPLYAERKAVYKEEDIIAYFWCFEAAKAEFNIKDENI